MSSYHKRHKQQPKEVAMPTQNTAQPPVERFTTLGQRYAQAAWLLVTARAGDSTALATNPESKRYRARCRSLPVMIHQCGLAQTLAFCQSRASAKDDPFRYGAWLEDIANILEKTPDELTTLAREAPLQRYMHLTHQVLHAASWLKSYAEAKIERGDAQDDESEA